MVSDVLHSISDSPSARTNLCDKRLRGLRVGTRRLLSIRRRLRLGDGCGLLGTSVGCSYHRHGSVQSRQLSSSGGGDLGEVYVCRKTVCDGVLWLRGVEEGQWCLHCVHHGPFGHQHPSTVQSFHDVGIQETLDEDPALCTQKGGNRQFLDICYNVNSILIFPAGIINRTVLFLSDYCRKEIRKWSGNMDCSINSTFIYRKVELH